MKAGGKKYDKGKLEWDMLEWDVIEDIVRVCNFGAYDNDYGKNDWQKGILCSRLFSAAMRHMKKAWMGQWLDEDDPETRQKGSGLPHLAHAMWNLMAWQWMINNRPDLDDRPKTINDQKILTPQEITDDKIFSKTDMVINYNNGGKLMSSEPTGYFGDEKFSDKDKK